MKKIILSGYMASGKTTIGQLLAKASGFAFIDLDAYIEKSMGKTIAELFAHEGEIKFRKLEHLALKELVTDNETEGFVLALGGGTPCYANNHEFLQGEDVLSIYLKAGIEELIMRIKAQKVQRPLLDNVKEGELGEFVAKHLFDRSYFYHKAKHVVAVDGKTPEAIVNQIMSLF